MSEVEDRELLVRWQAGDKDAGEALVERYFDAMYRFFHSKLDGQVDELVQATFEACVAAKDRFEGRSSFRTFLYGIARNQLYTALRARQRDARHLELEVSSIADLVSTPRTKLARSAEYERLVAHLRRLPVDQHTLLEMHYWSDLGIAEIAEIFHAPEVTIRSRLHRARLALRELLLDDPALDSIEAMDNWASGLKKVKL